MPPPLLLLLLPLLATTQPRIDTDAPLLAKLSNADKFDGNTSVPLPPTVTAVSPSAGSAAGGTRITISGVSLQRFRYCAFGHDAVMGSASGMAVVKAVEFGYSKQLVCVSPAARLEELVGSRLPVKVSEDGQEWEEAPVHFMYFHPETAKISDMEPTCGSRGGGTIVTFKGEDLNILSDVGMNNGESGYAARCVFGEIESEVTFISQDGSFGHCTVPALPIGVHPFSVALNGKDQTVSNSSFTATASPTVDALTPSQSDLDGGVMVVVSGKQLHGCDMPPLCKIGTQVSKAIEKDKDYVMCLSPPQSRPGNLSVSISINGVDFLGDFPLKYTSEFHHLTEPEDTPNVTADHDHLHHPELWIMDKISPSPSPSPHAVAKLAGEKKAAPTQQPSSTAAPTLPKTTAAPVAPKVQTLKRVREAKQAERGSPRIGIARAETEPAPSPNSASTSSPTKATTSEAKATTPMPPAADSTSGSTALKAAVRRGSVQVSVQDLDGFVTGSRIVINANGATREENAIVQVATDAVGAEVSALLAASPRQSGRLGLATPLQFDHKPQETIQILASTPAPPSLVLPSPRPKPSPVPSPAMSAKDKKLMRTLFPGETYRAIIVSDAGSGSVWLRVSNTSGFEIGAQVVLSPASEAEEDFNITAVQDEQIKLSKELQLAHTEGQIVIQVGHGAPAQPPAPTDPPSTTTTTTTTPVVVAKWQPESLEDETFGVLLRCMLLAAAVAYLCTWCNNWRRGKRGCDALPGSSMLMEEVEPDRKYYTEKSKLGDPPQKASINTTK